MKNAPLLVHLLECSTKKCHWENMEDFFKKGTMLSFPAQPVGWRPVSTHLHSFSVNPLLTGNTVWFSRHSSLKPEHLWHINEVRCQKTQIHRAFLMENGKKSWDSELTRASVHTWEQVKHLNRIYCNRICTGTLCSSLTRKDSLAFFPFLNAARPMAS